MMRFCKLIMNELVKALKKKSTLIFSIFAIIAIFLSCLLVHVKKNYYMVEYNYGLVLSEDDAKINLAITKAKLASAKEEDKKFLAENIKVYEYVIDNGTEKILNAEYKQNIMNKLMSETERLYSIDMNLNKKDYDIQKAKVDRLWELLKGGTFEEYIAFNKDEIKNSYENKAITEEEYITKNEEQNKILKYEISKYSFNDSYWKQSVLSNNSNIDYKIKERFDITNKTYIDDKAVEKLKEQKLINEYRLENNVAPYYTDGQIKYNVDSYSRYKFNEFANTISTIFIGLLIIVLAASAISEETSSGTIKFMLITPYKRGTILLAKIIAITVILIISILIISQISVIVGNISFGSNTNPYLYVKDGVVNVMSTHLYETLQYLLKIPGILICMLLGITLSTLTRNTPISVIITAALFIAVPFGMTILNNFMVIDFLKYLPFNNFELISKVFPIETYETIITSVVPTTLNFSIKVLSVTAILLIITAFESFRKKDIA
ncbi:MAG: ABC transporter permease subunit [Clostridia bacterium]|nr:ABC transporter permease subunit [Clostridia bacterium]